MTNCNGRSVNLDNCNGMDPITLRNKHHFDCKHCEIWVARFRLSKIEVCITNLANLVKMYFFYFQYKL
jgi:hypothetical protein